jgi:hypothetical protein
MDPNSELVPTASTVRVLSSKVDPSIHTHFPGLLVSPERRRIDGCQLEVGHFCSIYRYLTLYK